MRSELWHHGVKGMKWGIRRTPEELAKARRERLANQENSVTLKNGVYESSKGFTCAEEKMSGWCLKPGTKHSKEFFDVGYKPSDKDRLIRDINDGYDQSKVVPRGSDSRNYLKYEVEMELGVTKKRNFVTSWSIAHEGDQPKFVTAYRRKPKQKGD